MPHHTATDMQTNLRHQKGEEAHTLKDYEELDIYFKQRTEH